jgi:hypothetical protein
VAIGYDQGNIGSNITLRIEYKEKKKINSLNKEILAKINEIRTGNVDLAHIKQQIADELTALAAVKTISGKYSEFIRMLNEINAELTGNIARFHNISLSVETVASKLLVIWEGLKENIGKF